MYSAVFICIQLYSYVFSCIHMYSYITPQYLSPLNICGGKTCLCPSFFFACSRMKSLASSMPGAEMSTVSSWMPKLSSIINILAWCVTICKAKKVKKNHWCLMMQRFCLGYFPDTFQEAGRNCRPFWLTRLEKKKKKFKATTLFLEKMMLVHADIACLIKFACTVDFFHILCMFFFAFVLASIIIFIIEQIFDPLQNWGLELNPTLCFVLH